MSDMTHKTGYDICRKVGIEILKYLLGALAGALGMSVSGCASLPIFVF